MRKRLFLSFALLVSSALILFSLGYTQFGLNPVVDRIAASHFNAAALTVESSINRLFDPVETWVGIARRWADSSPFDENHPEAFNKLMQPVLLQQPQFTSIVAGTSDGRGWMLLQLSDNAWLNRFTNIPLRGNKQIFVDWTADGHKQIRHEAKDYDPRLRPWYQGATTLKYGEIYWTDPYVFFTTRDPGITASTATVLPDGNTLVLGIDIKLLDISLATTKISVGNSGYAAAITSDGRLLGLPQSTVIRNDNAIRDLSLQPISTLGNPVMNKGFELWIQKNRQQDGVLHFNVDDVDWLASFRKVQHGNQVYWVSVFAPEDDFIPPLTPMIQVLGLIFVAVLVFSFLFAMGFTRHFSEPLELLAAASARIAQLDFRDGKSIHSPVTEIQQLATAQEQMRSMLSDYQHTVTSQADNLRQQIIALQSAESQFEHLSHHDPLTTLPNRLLLNHRLAIAVKTAEQYGTRFAVLFIDLDRFKAVNDAQGHPIGDQLLCVVAKRINGMLRKSDTLARLGGDEFVLIADALEDLSNIENLALRLLETLAIPLNVGDNSFHISGSIGISVYPVDATDPVTLIRNADSAMYQAKSHGRNTFRFYSEDMTRTAVARLQMEEALHLAIERDELELHYQPQINLQTGEVIGVEALIRWRQPSGLIAPQAFIPLAEETGLIGRIGEWVLEQSCRQWAEWSQQGITLSRLAVNLSVKQLQDTNFSALIKQVLDKTGVPADVLELEMTESILLESPEALCMLLDIGSTGVSFALDDFGTGYSSLGYLKKLPLARLKIDRGFTWDIGKDADGEAVVRGIIGLAAALGRGVIAEGVETREQAEFMLQHGCYQAQGYYFSKPLPANEFASWWHTRKTESGTSEYT